MQARALAVWFVVASAAAAQEVRMAEALPVDAAYRVNCRVKIAGKLKLPDKAALDVEGESVIEYDERVLAVGPSSDVERAIRWVERMDFARKVGGEAQRASLRPVARRLVILRAGNLEVPFSPDGPLTWSEIDLVRTDVFTPALAGLLPRGAVRVGDTWQATETAARELTDLGKITNGGLTCRLERVDRALGPATAKVTVSGTIRGVGENGPTQHTLDGFYYFDLDGQKLRYVSLKGTESLLDAQGQPQGEVTGTFVLTRDPATAPRTIAADVAGQRLEPTDANTELLFEDDDLGIRFQHGRRWRARQSGNQIALDDHRGNGLLLTVEPVNRLPTAVQFQEEAKKSLAGRKANLLFASPVRPLQRAPVAIDEFSIDADLPMNAETRRASLWYAVARGQRDGATVAATLVTADRAVLQRDVERLVLGLRLR